MLIDAGEEKHVLTFEPVIARNHIGQHHLVGMPDVRRGVGVIDGGGNEKGLRHARDTLADGDYARNLP